METGTSRFHREGRSVITSLDSNQLILLTNLTKDPESDRQIEKKISASSVELNSASPYYCPRSALLKVGSIENFEVYRFEALKWAN